jgi:zinc transport system permease protein
VLDERGARLSGIRVKTVNFIFTLLTAITVSAAARIVGALIVSSLMVLPVACALQTGKSFRASFFQSVAFSLVFMLCGIALSYYIDGLRTGGAVVLTGIVIFIFIILINHFK